MSLSIKPFMFLFPFLLYSGTAQAQQTSKSLISVDNNHFYIGIYNFFHIIAQQPTAVAKHQLEAFTVTYEPETFEPIKQREIELEQAGDRFILQIDSLEFFCIAIKFKDGTEEQHYYESEPLPAVARVGIWSHRTKEAIPTLAFKAQQGLYTTIENLDISAQCRVIQFEVTHISTTISSETVLNEGGYWQPATAALILKAQPGDRYLFSNIRYRCPGSQKDQWAANMIFELK